MQGRYGKGVIAWDLSDKVKLAGVVVDKPSHMATIHLTKGAPKSTRLDAITIRKRAATRGDAIVEVKPGEEVVSVNVNWTVEKYVAASPNAKANGHKTSSPKEKAEPSSKAQGTSEKKKVAKAKAPAKESAPRRSATKTKTPKKKVKGKK